MSLELRYGVIIGGAVSAWVLIEFVLGLHTTHIGIGQYTGFVASVIAVVLLYKALKQKRDLELGGMMSVGQGIKAGLAISFVSGVISTLFFVLYYNVINPDWLQIALDWQREVMLAGGREASEIDASLEQMKTSYSISVQLLWGFLSTIGMGLIVSGVLSLFLKKDLPEQR